MRVSLRALLTAVFLFGQLALASHHHEEARLAYGPASAVARRPAAALSPADDCALCAAQAQPTTSAPEPIVVVVPSFAVAVLAFPSLDALRDSRPARVSDRSPPVV